MSRAMRSTGRLVNGPPSDLGCGQNPLSRTWRNLFARDPARDSWLRPHGSVTSLRVPTEEIATHEIDCCCLYRRFGA